MLKTTLIVVKKKYIQVLLGEIAAERLIDDMERKGKG